MKAKIFFSLLVIAMNANAGQLDQKSATVNMQVGKYARISGLDNFTLLPTGEDGAASAIYAGSDSFNLEANCPVQVVLSGGQLSNGTDTIQTSYGLDSAGTSFSTVDRVHNQQHNVSAQATLGNISSQEAGAYSANITLTISSL